ncbi:MAG: hypothetical protein PHW03_05310 [Eubacteriales bacterium]|nr:hypothetical protein [Eubacteriales bacterium]
MTTKFRKKPVIVDAEQFTEENKNRCLNFVRCNSTADFEDGKPILKIQTIHGDIAIVRLGDWVVKEQDCPGHFYPVNPNVFKNTYEPEKG